VSDGLWSFLVGSVDGSRGTPGVVICVVMLGTAEMAPDNLSDNMEEILLIARLGSLSRREAASILLKHTYP
jgi:hypothetical protein